MMNNSNMNMSDPNCGQEVETQGLEDGTNCTSENLSLTEETQKQIEEVIISDPYTIALLERLD